MIFMEVNELNIKSVGFVESLAPHKLLFLKKSVSTFSRFCYCNF